MLPGTILISWKIQMTMMILLLFSLKGQYDKTVTSFRENSSESKGVTQPVPKAGTMSISPTQGELNRKPWVVQQLVNPHLQPPLVVTAYSIYEIECLQCPDGYFMKFSRKEASYYRALYSQRGKFSHALPVPTSSPSVISGMAFALGVALF